MATILDLDAAKKADKGHTFNVLGPQGDTMTNSSDGSLMTMTVIGAESGTMKKAFSAMGFEASNMAARALTISKAEQIRAKHLHKGVTGFNIDGEDGFKIEFSPEEALRIFLLIPDVSKQAQDVMEDKGNFI